LQGDFSIGDWHVQPQINCVQKEGASLHLEPKVMQVLLLLASHPGEVISKDRLLNTVWSGVFVGEDVLTRSISEIRRAFDDDARSPRVIQTIPKTGYRLIASVSPRFENGAPVNGKALNGTPASTMAEPTPASDPEVVLPGPPLQSEIVLGRAEPMPPAKRAFAPLFPWIAAGLLLVAGLIAAAIYRFHAHSAPATPNLAYTIVPFTSYPGSEGQAAFSPDGNQIAFVWDGPRGDHKNIYVKILGTSTPLRLTTDADEDVGPAWSPDGRFIAFTRLSADGNSIYIVPAIGGPERRLYTMTDPTSWEYGGLTWTDDGKHIVFPDRPSYDSPSALFSLSLDTLTRVRLTSPPASWDGDWTPVMSPDGTKIAFIRSPEGSVRDLYVMEAAGGKVTQLTHDGKLVVGLTWTADSQDVVFSSNREGEFALWKVPAVGGAIERVAVGDENSYSPAISRKGNLLAYSHGTGKWDIVRVDLKSSARKVLTDQLLSSNEQDAAPEFSPDGKRIAFQSWRSGSQEIWICSADGSDPVQLTTFGGALTGSPHWSPDGRQIAFDSRPGGRAHIFLTSPDGGVPRALTSGNYNDIVPSWSPDGKTIYFGSIRRGGYQIWKVAASGGSPQQLTTHGGMIARASPDGDWVYYTRPQAAGLWRIPVGGGSEQQVLTSPPDGFQGYWTLTKDGIYYLDSSRAQPAIEFAPFATPGRSVRVHVLDHEPTLLSGLSVSPDGRWLIYADMAEAGSNIALVENFR
jgi:Tol biopolymer transport system component/DNA-binding winged helix-turn-helix (wHTH) protein